MKYTRFILKCLITFDLNLFFVRQRVNDVSNKRYNQLLVKLFTFEWRNKMSLAGYCVYSGYYAIRF